MNKPPCDGCERFRLEWGSWGRCGLTGRRINLDRPVLCKRRKNNA